MYYRDKNRGFQRKEHSLDGVSEMVYDGVFEVCEFRLNLSEDVKAVNLSIKELIKCLKKIIKSVRFWNQKYGARGYLDYVKNFL